MHDYEFVPQFHLPFEVKSLNEKGIIEGHAAVMGNVDLGGDKILTGAFDRTLRETKGVVPMYWSHDSRKIPLGYGLEASATNRVLEVKGEMTLDIQEVRDAYASLKHAKAVGYRMGLSIGYRIPKDGWDMDGEIRLLKDIDLIEWSPTPHPMNTRARVSNVKAFTGATERDFEAFLRDAAGFTHREAQTIISRGFRALKAVRDVEPDAKKVLGEIESRLQFERGLAELRNQIHI